MLWFLQSVSGVDQHCCVTPAWSSRLVQFFILCQWWVDVLAATLAWIHSLSVTNRVSSGAFVELSTHISFSVRLADSHWSRLSYGNCQTEFCSCLTRSIYMYKYCISDLTVVVICLSVFGNECIRTSAFSVEGTKLLLWIRVPHILLLYISGSTQCLQKQQHKEWECLKRKIEKFWLNTRSAEGVMR